MQDTPATPTKTNPLLVIAAVSMILFCGVGVAMMTGVIPDSKSNSAPVNPIEVAATKIDGKSPESLATDKPITGMTNSAKPGHAKTPETRSDAKPAVAAPRKTSAPTMAQIKASEKIALNDVQPAKVCGNCGVVTSVDLIQEKGEGSGIGAVAGVIGGGLLGNQFGDGKGRKLATVAGAVGGGFAGHEIEKQIKKTTRYDILVQMESGGYRSFSEETDPSLVAGDKVRIEGGDLIKE